MASSDAGPLTLPLVLDGAMGTELLRLEGIGPKRGPERGCLAELVLTRPSEVLALHRAYVAAGAGALHTNTFGANRPQLSPHGLEDRVRAINVEAARIARGAAGSQCLVLGDLGPLAEASLGAEARRSAYQEQVSALVEGGVDALHAETVLGRADLEALLFAAATESPTLPLFVSLTVEPGTGGYCTPGREPTLPLVEMALAAGVVGLGLNCTLTAREMVPAVRWLRALLPAGFPLPAQPCASIPPAVPTTPEELAATAASLRAAGATSIGGCCGTTPAHVKAVYDMLARG